MQNAFLKTLKEILAIVKLNKRIFFLFPMLYVPASKELKLGIYTR